MDRLSKFFTAHSHLLEIISEDFNLPRALETFCLDTEDLVSGVRCSILLLDADGKHIRLGAAPSLPDFYNEAVDGLEIGVGVGSCGTAMFLGERVIVEDIHTHPYWAPFLELARKAGIVACWSEPIQSKDKTVVGSFAMYYDEIRVPDEWELNLIEVQAKLAGLAIERLKSEETIREREQMLNSIFENLPIALSIKDENHRVEKTNKTYMSWYGLDAKKVIGEYTDNIFPVQSASDNELMATQEDIALMYTQEKEVLSSGAISHRTVQRSFDDGKTHTVDITKFPIPGPENKAAKIGTIGVDMTKQVEIQKALESSETRFREFAQMSSDWFWETDEHLRHVFISDGYGKITREAPPRLLGKTHREMLGGMDSKERTDWEGLSDLLETHQDFENFVYIHMLETGGKRLVLRISGKAMVDESGRFIGYRGIGLDITSLMRIQDELRISKELAEKANQAKSEFLAAMSHDLRTPLNAIMGFSDVLKNQYFGPPGAGKYREYAGDIHESAEHLLELVNDILDLSAIEAGRMSADKRLLALHPLLEECVRIVKGQASEKGVVLTSDFPTIMPPFHADQRMLRQIFVNLLGNAVKFTPRGGKVVIEARALDGRVEILISDTGEGIPENLLSKILNPFERHESNPYTAEKGWGLGLAIAKSLVQIHDGVIEIESEVGKGTCVKVSLPTRVQDSPPPPPPPPIKLYDLGVNSL